MNSYIAKITIDKDTVIRTVEGKANSAQEFHKTVFWNLNNNPNNGPVEEILEIENAKTHKTVYRFNVGFSGS